MLTWLIDGYRGIVAYSQIGYHMSSHKKGQKGPHVILTIFLLQASSDMPWK
jgi:hypothetical protein